LSLNWREIDRILSEIPLQGAIVRQIYQPSHPVLILELYQRGSTFRLMFCLANPNCRLHLTARKPANPARAPRFVTFLRARIRDGRIVSSGQLGRERIVRLEVLKNEERVLLWARLWGGAANLIVTDPQGTVLDALYRRPRRGEASGGRFQPEAAFPPGASLQQAAGTAAGAGDRGANQTGALAAEPTDREAPAQDGPPGAAAADDRFQVRELPGSGSFNERVERFYAALEEGQELQRLSAQIRTRLTRRENQLLAALENLGRRRSEHGRYEELKSFGELILSHLHTLRPGERWLAAEDFADPGHLIEIELDPQASPAENAERYFRRYRKAKTALQHLEQEEHALRRELAAVQRELESLAGQQELESLRARADALIGRRPTPARDKERPPGLEFSSGAFRLLVGRSAAENDLLLRRFVRGNDTWVHARDYPGAYVFVRGPAGKSVPLDTLLDAANLALHYSKGKSSGQGDVYYTQVKYLRRAREGKTGMVIPTREKNLHVRIEAPRLERLLGSY
jgi:predicted ribosome quality control (RQC) complex YloA/Tae2 family protein